jgi:hypothetical protein
MDAVQPPAKAVRRAVRVTQRRVARRPDNKLAICSSLIGISLPQGARGCRLWARRRLTAKGAQQNGVEQPAIHCLRESFSVQSHCVFGTHGATK